VVRLTGGDHLVGFNRLRADAVDAGLLPAPVPPSQAAATLSARFGQAQREGIEKASAQVTARALAALPVAERAKILSGPVTLDLDAKDIEVFSTRKERVIRSYQGEIAGRVHAAHRAQAQAVLAADLLDGRFDGPTVSPAQIDRAVDAVRAAGATGRIRFQGDCGYYAGKVSGSSSESDGCLRARHDDLRVIPRLRGAGHSGGRSGVVRCRWVAARVSTGVAPPLVRRIRRAKPTVVGCRPWSAGAMPRPRVGPCCRG
jgi:hypothetical protein